MMKLLFKQRMFSWFDSYDIYDEFGNIVYEVKGEFSCGHCLKIYDMNGIEVGTVKEKMMTFMPKFEMYFGETYVGSISKEFALFKPQYKIDYYDWSIEGEWLEWDYTITSADGNKVAEISKQIFKLTDTYVIDVAEPKDALGVLMFVLALDAEKCSRN